MPNQIDFAQTAIFGLVGGVEQEFCKQQIICRLALLTNNKNFVAT